MSDIEAMRGALRAAAEETGSIVAELVQCQQRIEELQDRVGLIVSDSSNEAVREALATYGLVRANVNDQSGLLMDASTELSRYSSQL